MYFLICENENFSIEHSYSCAIPGYLIISPLVEVASIVELPPAAQVQLGPTLAFAADKIKDIVNSIKVYCAQYSEEDTHFHFHVFPRTAEITGFICRGFPRAKKSNTRTDII